MTLSYLKSKSSKGLLEFEIKSDVKKPLEKSMVNGIRRTILNDIPTVGIPQDQIHIEKNETALHNEFMKHRISLIPLYLNPLEYKFDYLFVLDVENKTDNVRVITTDDLKIYPLKSDIVNKDGEFNKSNYDTSSQISEKDKKNILKPYEIEGITSYIIITELKNKTSIDEYQSLKLWFYPRIGTAKENALFNNISQCSYSYKEDPDLLKKAMVQDIEIHKIEGQTNIKKFEKEFTNSYRQRYFHRNLLNEPFWYIFSIKSNHYFKSKQIFKNSLDILIDKLNRCSDNLKLITVDPSKSRYSVNIKENRALHFMLNDENDTIGNILQTNIVDKINDSSLITFCGYKKIHPLEEIIQLVIYHTLIDEMDDTSIISKVVFSLSDIIDGIVNIFQSLIDKTNEI